MPGSPRGMLFVVSAPSGTGKTTLVEHLVQRVQNLTISCSYTSRLARTGEVDGVDYHFVSRSQFEAMLARQEFLEWADLYGHLYGTAAPDTEAHLAAGRDLVLVIDVQGANQIRRRGSETVSVFVLPPSMQVLERRLRGRSRDGEEEIRRRLEVARGEVDACRDYDYIVINREIEATVDELRSIVVAERARCPRARPAVEEILETFRAVP